MPRRYRSRIDAIWVVLFLACAAAFLAGVVNRSANPAMSRMLLELTLCVATVFICIGVPCHYTLLDKGVRIQSGLFIREVPYGNILSVDPENGTQWAPAWSRQRLVLHCRHGNIRVSPLRREAFMAELQARLHESVTAG